MNTALGSISVKVEPAASGSKWKPKTLRAHFPIYGWPGEAGWIGIPLRGTARSVRVRGSVPLKDLPFGWSPVRLTVQGGGQAAPVFTFPGEVTVPGGPEVTVQLPEGEARSLDVTVSVKNGPKAARMVVLVDGRPVAVGGPEGGRFQISAETAHIGAGEHDVTAEIVADRFEKAPSVLEARHVIARSRPGTVRIARVLSADFSPHAAVAGKPVLLKFRGDYLRENVVVRVGEEVGKLRRNGRYPFVFEAEFTFPEPRRLDVRLENGDKWRISHGFLEIIPVPAEAVKGGKD
jgi:hypothetical protein